MSESNREARERLRKLIQETQFVIDRAYSNSRQRSIAQTKLDECRLWCNEAGDVDDGAFR